MIPMKYLTLLYGVDLALGLGLLPPIPGQNLTLVSHVLLLPLLLLLCFGMVGLISLALLALGVRLREK